MDNIFFCIVQKTKEDTLYYMGYFKPYLSSTLLVPATSTYLSEALKITFEQESTAICKALGFGWEVKKHFVDSKI